MAQLSFSKAGNGFYKANVIFQGNRMAVHIDLKEEGSVSVLAGLSGMRQQAIYEAQAKDSHVFELDVPNGVTLTIQASKEPELGKWV